jgi:hypothetical protein
MINHVVLFKMKIYADAEAKRTALETFRSKLMALKDHIAELKHIEVGLHHQLDTETFDLSLITHFDNLEALEAYRIHPEHVKIIDFVKENTVQRAVVDSVF